MATSKTHLPSGPADLFLTDGGIETTLVFREGFDLPYFAAFDLLKNEEGCHALRRYYSKYLKIAQDFNVGFILESPTWRANPDWIEKIGYPGSAITEINEKAIQLLDELKAAFTGKLENIVISGCIGPRGDGYNPEYKMTADEAKQYHARQIEVFYRSSVDMVSAITMNYVEEAIGITEAAAKYHLPVVISFTVETDGKLPTGMSLQEAIEKVDDSVEVQPLYYMINCAHPAHFKNELLKGENGRWVSRIKAIRANASTRSHAELDEATELDRGNPHELGNEYKHLKDTFGHLIVFGGCCGTDEEHIINIMEQIKRRPAIDN